MRVFFCFIQLFITLPAFSFYNNEDDFIKLTKLDQYNITAKLTAYTVGKKAVNAQTALLYYTAGKFKPVVATNNEFINDGLVSSEKWFALPLENNNDAEITTVLEFILSGVNKVACFTVDDVRKIKSVLSSQKTGEKSFPKLLSSSVTFNISFEPHENNLLLIHTINRGHLLHIPAKVYELSFFRDYDNLKNKFFGIFQGIFIFIILFNFLIYISTFDRIYLLYMIYAFFIGFFALNDVGAAPYDLIPLTFFSGQTFLLFALSAWLLLMKHFLNLTTKSFITYNMLQVLITVNLVYAFLPYCFDLASAVKLIAQQTFYQVGLTILFASNLAFIVMTTVSRISYKDKLAIFYGIANIPVILGTLIYYTNYYLITNIPFGWLNPMALGLSIETFALSFGFAYRFNLIGKEKRQLLLQVNKHQHEITNQIIITQEAERQRIAEDIHDDLGGNLAALKMKLQSFQLPQEQSNSLIQLIDNAADNSRNISHNLMPPEFTKTKLKELLAAHYRQVRLKNGAHFNFYNSGNNTHFDKQTELIIYRIIMELTNNIIKHSNSTEATIQLVYHEKQLMIMAEDNGQGIILSDNDGIGLRNVGTRVSFLKGSMNIDTGNKGTTVVIHIPYEETE
jgi:signal transduction histidine kinase